MFFVKFVTYKIFNLLSVLVGIVLILFLIAKVIPGDPARAAAGPGATIEQLEKIRKEYSLDQPTHVQIYRYFKNILSIIFNLKNSRNFGINLECIRFETVCITCVINHKIIKIIRV